MAPAYTAMKSVIIHIVMEQTLSLQYIFPCVSPAINFQSLDSIKWWVIFKTHGWVKKGQIQLLV